MTNKKKTIRFCLLLVLFISGCARPGVNVNDVSTSEKTAVSKPGTQLEYKIDFTKIPSDEKNDTILGIKDVIKKRVARLGVTDSKIYTVNTQDEEHLIVEMPDLEYKDEMRSELENKNLLEFKEQSSAPPGFKGTDTMEDMDTWKETGLNSKNLILAYVETDKRFEPNVVIKFNDEGSKLFEEITSRNIGKPLGIFVSGQLITAPTVHEKISGDHVQIGGQITMDEARSLANDINQGILYSLVELINVSPLQ